jgi:hypothetical protein
LTTTTITGTDSGMGRHVPEAILSTNWEGFVVAVTPWLTIDEGAVVIGIIFELAVIHAVVLR